MDGMEVKLTAEPWRDNIDRDMSLAEHLTELRSCLVKAGAALVAGTAVSFYYLEQIMAALTASILFATGRGLYGVPKNCFTSWLDISFAHDALSAVQLCKAGVNSAGKALCSLHNSYNYSAFSWGDALFLLSCIS